ncbi:hypothetical protein C8C85_1929 [Flavobacterium sp. 103]|uniref:hypothetical protein n=1 Tax=Flavobacterium sp. 103 TaxID=2135624 RepID=UPI000D5C8FF4|nr:hypothetical protein [Flavobacterium sp. 103]PVX46110.1 hypothetical protein C8C85_1929 [Flavobacterium sp. 103]
MKKKLEADLISIAHRILQLKNKSDINQLFLETQKLYEKLAVLRFVEEHFSDAKPTIGQAEVVEKMKEFFENISVPEFQRPPSIIKADIEEAPVAEIIEDKSISPIKVEEVIKEEDNKVKLEEIIATSDEVPTSDIPEPLLEETKVSEDIIAEKIEEETPIEKPIFLLEETEIEPIATTIVEPIETVKPESPKKKEIVQISFDDLLGGKYTAPDFVKVSPSDKKQETDSIQPTPDFDFPNEPISNAPQTTFEKAEPKTITLNDKLAKEINIGLNDRIAFVKHLFGGNNEDYNRVVNQLITFDTFIETKAFIDEMVKPDYNNWEGKEDYEHRFMEIIEKKFLSF